jgi:hypothetical protein
MTPPASLRAQRAFMRLWFARLFAVAGGQMLMVAVGGQIDDLTGSAGGLGLVGLVGLWLRLVPTLATRDALLQAGTAKP